MSWRLPLALLPLAACQFDPSGTGASVDASTNQPDAALSSTDASADSSSSSFDANVQHLEVAIASGTDDALQDPGGPMLVDYSWVSLYSGDHFGALRFQLGGVEAGATIVAAHLEVFVDSNLEGDPNVLIAVQDSVAPAALTTAANDISNRTTTGTTVLWQQTGLPQGTAVSPSVSSLVSDVISLPGWTSGSRVMFVLDGQTGTSFEYRQLEHVSGDPAKLVLDFINP